MARHTKQSIERALLKGEAISWKEPSGLTSRLVLETPAKRRLFQALWKTPFHDSKGLTESFTNGLWLAYSEGTDPSAASQNAGEVVVAPNTVWRIERLETENFGGINAYGGTLFSYHFSQESLLIEGPNGSGKSSFIGALAWAFTGRRPRDHSDDHADRSEPVLDEANKVIGNWPPVTCYPPKRSDISIVPTTRVKVYLRNGSNEEATIERKLINGELQEVQSPNLAIPEVLIETGVLMPLRLAQIKVKDTNGQLPDAVQKLTGLDEVSALGTLCADLCHGGREYLKFSKNQRLDDQQSGFSDALSEARRILLAVGMPVSPYMPSDSVDATGPIALFGKSIVEKATVFTTALAEDLAPNLELGNAKTQAELAAVLATTKGLVNLGLENSATWNFVKKMGNAITPESAITLRSRIVSTKEQLRQAVALHNRGLSDSRYQLKAVGASWHEKNHGGAVDTCPLCDFSLEDNRQLKEDLEQLRSAGAAAQRVLIDNINACNAELVASVPEAFLESRSVLVGLRPKESVTRELRTRLIDKNPNSEYLASFLALFENALSNAPSIEALEVAVSQDTDFPEAKIFFETLELAEKGLSTVSWFENSKSSWQEWWDKYAGVGPSADGVFPAAAGPRDLSTTETVNEHLGRLELATQSAEPYRLAAGQLRLALKYGREVTRIQTEQSRRQEVADALQPLKALVPLAESIARQAIDDLSDRIERLLGEFHLSERLRFHNTSLQKKAGLVVRAGFTPEIRIDATLIANTSWFRSTLWAFIFALREEAVEQHGSDAFPVLIFDDPQATFDNEHRLRWAQYVASLQVSPLRTQVVLATHDQSFIDTTAAAQISGRKALIAAAGVALGHIGFFEGGILERAWSEVFLQKTPKASQIYLQEVRIYLEGMLKIMLQGEDSNVGTKVVGDLRELISQLHDRGIAPWNRVQFQNLASALKKQPETKFFEASHHSSGSVYGVAEATDLQKHWQKTLGPLLKRCFLMVRDYQLRHGNVNRLQLSLPSSALPEGYQAQLRAHKLQVLGRASALSDGRVADGRLIYSAHSATETSPWTYGKHFAYKLTVPTLEPVAKPGDVLLIRELGEPEPKSLVVALTEERILARRFDLADNDSDIAVLTAQAIDPFRIAAPVVAHRGSLKLYKIVGVLFDEYQPRLIGSTDEIAMCDSNSVVASLLPSSVGLVQVVGESAQPIALDGQYLLVRPPVTSYSEFHALDGKPIIALDTEGGQFFKRLRVVSPQQVILESLDAGGAYPPEVLSIGKSEDSGGRCIEKVWPVAGVIFEKPE